jgi:hypothetical protein
MLPAMPEPLRGLVPIAEYGSKFEVDLAVAALHGSGIGATASYDPAANTAAPFFASDHTFELLVHEDDVEAAVARLQEVVTDLPPEFHDERDDAGPRPPSRRRRVHRRIVMVGIIAFFAIPALMVVALELAGS